MLDYRLIGFSLTCAVTLTTGVIYLNDMKNQINTTVDEVNRYELLRDKDIERTFLLQSQVNSQKHEIQYLKAMMEDCRNVKASFVPVAYEF